MKTEQSHFEERKDAIQRSIQRMEQQTLVRGLATVLQVLERIETRLDALEKTQH